MEEEQRAGGHGCQGVKRFWIVFGLLTAGFSLPLWTLAEYAAAHSLHSHIFLVPLVSAYLIYSHRKQIKVSAESSPMASCGVILLGIAAGVYAYTGEGGGWSAGDVIALSTLSYLLLAVGTALWFLGWETLRQILFPVFFLIFLIPLPQFAVEQLERLLMLASAEASYGLFRLTGTPAYKSGQVIELPGIVLEVARECSGIRSTWVLFITSLLASYLFLKSSLRRALLVALVIPLGVFRNALRIVVIGELCVRMGPEMIDSWIHRRGGPVFFGISLIPLFLVLGLLWRGERKGAAKKEGDEAGQAEILKKA